TGFEVQERHQAASYPHVIEEAVSCHDLLYQEKCQKTRPAWRQMKRVPSLRPATGSFAGVKAKPYCPFQVYHEILAPVTLNSCIITEKSSREVLP
ncbi:MAG: hypothetical protein WAQ10_04485, partial [Dethiobacteria bacterium]